MTSPLVDRLGALAADRIALEDEAGAKSFKDLWEAVLRARAVLCRGARSLEGARVAILASPGAGWVTAFFGVIASGGVAVPLSPLYPAAELAYFADDAGASAVVVSEDLREHARAVSPNRRVVSFGEIAGATAAPGPAPDLAPGDTALLLYTSGTTGKPKGARITHANVAQQAALLRDAWALAPDDGLLHALPLHHLHGLGISLLNVLLAGASARMLPRFDARRVWDELAGGSRSVWMAVPTMYQRLFEAFDAADAPTRARWAAGAARLRLATSGSAALPVTLAERWRALTGAIPLERFGMTEIGVGTSNPLDPSARRAGTVGRPLPTVETRLVGDDGADVERGPGELLVRGPSVFAGYFGRDDATRAAFRDGWFATGDVAERSDDGYVRLLGRTSVDILKSGGYKLSALEIEEALREHAAVREVAVVGVPDERWGERVVAAVVAAPGRAAECSTDALRAFCRDRLPPYKIPREVVVLEALPRNALGKVQKPELVRALTA
ncbi:MAG TPA: AMP-binding protein [Minicystis sp.]|nr:AMP-binding protein [Minicystis sp.]